MLPKSDAIAWDAEWAEGGKIVDYFTMLSCAGDGFCYVAVGEENIRALANELIQSGAELVTHNGWNADIPLAAKQGLNFSKGTDTMVLAYLIDETVSKSLESLAVQHLGVKGWKHDNWEDFDPTSEEAATYAARDATYTLRLYRRFKDLLGDRVVVANDILRPAHEALSAMSERGIFIDASAVARERLNAEIEIRESLAALLAIVGDEDFNPGSTKQVAKYLNEQGVRLSTSEKGNPVVDVKALNEINNDFTRALLRYRKAKKTMGTYVTNYEEIMQTGDGRVHPTYNIIRTLTGRSSASNENVQNLPRQYKDFFGAPLGRVFVECDYSAVEFRIAAWVAGETSILERYRLDPDWDAHRFFAARFYGIPEDRVTKDQRQIAKSANFGLLFLGNGVTLVEYAKGLGLELTLEFCDKVFRAWHEVFPGFRRFYSTTKDIMILNSEVATLTGHVRHFGDISIMDRKGKAEALRQAVNTQVQGLAAHIALIAGAEMHRLGLPLTGFFHDAYSFEFENEKTYLRSKDLIEDSMCNYPVKFLRDKFNIQVDVPLRVEFKHKVY